MSYVLDTLGYDCVLSRTVSSPDKMLLASFLYAHESFGYVVVTPEPVVQSVPLARRMFSWAAPFSGALGLCRPFPQR